jgi:predicted NACHT family NTPase
MQTISPATETFLVPLAPIDVNKVIAELIKTYGKEIWNCAKSKYKRRKIKNEIEYLTAYEDYLKQAWDKYSKVKTILFNRQPQELYSFYECIGLEFRNNKLTRQARAKTTVIDTSIVKNVLDYTKHAIITGTGGIGKSTLLKHLFLSSICTKQSIPIFVELRSIDESESVLDCIYRNVSNLGFNLEKEYFEYGLSCGNHLLLFDGYDEVS